MKENTKIWESLTSTRECHFLFSSVSKIFAFQYSENKSKIHHQIFMLLSAFGIAAYYHANINQLRAFAMSIKIHQIVHYMKSL